MKAIYCLLALGLVGWVSSEHGFKTGKTYHYAVRGRLMNGLTEISTQYSGLEMDYKLRLSVTQHNIVNFKPQEMKFFEVNDVLNGGWRDGELRNERPVELSQEIRQYLESPMDVTFNKGVVESITVQGNLPTWAVNMKKAMASHFVLDTTGVNLVVEGNLNRKTGHETPEERNLESGFYYQTMEKTIHGECKTQYTVSQNGPFNAPFPFHQQHQPGVVSVDEVRVNVEENKDFIGELPWHQTYHKFCQENDQVFEIIKSLNFTSCIDKPLTSFMAPSLSNSARPGDNHFGGSMGLRTVVSRILACGKSRNEFQILKIRQEELVKVGLDETKKIMTGGIKNITLFQITEEQSPVPVTNPKVYNTILYRVSEKKAEEIMRMEDMLDTPMNDAGYMINFGEESFEENKVIDNEDIKVHPMPSLTQAPINPLLITPLKIEEMKTRVQVLIRDIVQDLLVKNRGTETLAEKETLSKISTVSKILKYFSYADVQELFNILATKHQSDEDKTTRQVFLDAVAIAGTNPNVKFLLDMIQKREITGYHVSSILMTLPMYIRTPTQQLLNEYFNLIKSEVLREDKQAKTTAILSFSTVLYEACVNTNIRQTRYPVALYGKFCDAQVVEQQFLPYFIQELEQFIHTKTEEQPENLHWKFVYLTAVGNIGHPAVLPILQKYMDNVQNPLVKTRVILALRHMIVSRSHFVQAQQLHHDIHVVDRDHHDILSDKIVEGVVMPILLSAAFDKGENTDVRMAAITMIFHSSAANKAIYQQLAYMTWFPASRQVHSFIYHSLKSMAEVEHPVHHVQNRMQTMARQVLPLVKPISVGMDSSRSIFHGDYINEFLSGYFSKLSYFGSRDSVLPNLVHYRSFYRFGGENGLGVNPIEFTIHGNTIQRILNEFTQQFTTPSVADSEHHEDLNKIHDILGIKDSKVTKKMEGYLYMKIRNEMERFITVNKESINEWTKTMKTDFLPKLRNGLPIHYQKTMRLSEYSQEFPSIFGLPMTYTHRMPLHVQVNGNMKLATAEKDWQMQLELRPVYAWKIHDKLSIKAPFLNKKYVTGLQKHFVAQFPLRALLRKAPRDQIILEITPTHLHEDTPTSEIRLFTFHRVPYTAIVTDECFPIFHREGAQVKVARVVETPYNNERRFGEHRFGLSLHVKEESDFQVEAEGHNQWINYLTKFHNVRTLMNMGWLGAQSTRWAKRTLSIDMAKSQTKTLAFVVGGNWEWNNKDVMDKARMENEERVYALAFIGKKNPILKFSTTSQIQKILVKGQLSTFHYLAHFAYTRGIHAQMNMRLVAGEATKEAAAKLPTEIPSLAAIRDYLIDSRVEVQEFTGCFELKSQVEIPTWANPREIVILRKRLLDQDLVMNKNTEIHFGSTCNQMPHQIKIKGQLKRGEKMTEWAKNKSPQAKRCEEDEKKGFSVSPVCLWVADHQAAALNVGDMEIQYTQNIPVWFQNVTYKMEDYLKAYLYTYMEHNRFPENELLNQQMMKIHFKMTPNKEFITLKINKPNAAIEFRNIKLTPWAKNFLPFTATQSLLENIKDRTFHLYSEQSCQIEGNWVSTFDNVTYSFGEEIATGCQHLLAKDCTGKYPLAVLVSDIHTQRKTVTVLLGGKTKVIITPSNSFMGLRKGQYKVTVNGEIVGEFPKVIRHPVSNELIAILEQMNNGGIQLRSRRVKVATDGSRVVVYGNGNDLKNKVCGICGNNDGEKSAELRSPKNCPLSNGSLLIASYAFDSLNQEHRGQCKVKPELRQRIEKENADCTRTHTIQQLKEINSDDEYMNVGDDKCNVRQRITKRFPGVGICQSERPVLQCGPGCYAKDTIEKEVEFKCSDRKPTPYTTYLNKMFTITLPTVCVH
jgi:hypothetical protein